ncbi:MAG TPA: TylF/MycF/NovP-related O-methyltransferase [Rhodocyclaceae bacterium]|nr:TylF/MycF/NovP-related O-methyltransferase [Rhodocyclaceae bacterium]HRQ45344.1 TylF/MycF/NovP-related O-methyltransferase [Rhodocyclaceae bacterium]
MTDFTSDRNERPMTKQHLVSYRTPEMKSALTELRTITEMLLPKFGDESWNKHNLLTLNVSVLSRILYLNELYQQIIHVPGVICEFGVQWGATLTQLINLRSIHEPFNHSRTIHGFDTFEGFPSVHPKDGDRYGVGDMATQSGHADDLERILSLIEAFPPLSHLKKFELIKGDASLTIDEWLAANPHAIISMAIFDMDLYAPTKTVLEKIRPRLVKGSVLAFDELNCRQIPGETRALDETIGLNNLRLRRSPLHPYGAWAVFGD